MHLSKIKMGCSAALAPIEVKSFWAGVPPKRLQRIAGRAPKNNIKPEKQYQT